MKTRILVILFFATVVMALFSVVANLVASYLWDSGIVKPYWIWITGAFLVLALALFGVSVWQFRIQRPTLPETTTIEVARQFLQFLREAAREHNGLKVDERLWRRPIDRAPAANQAVPHIAESESLYAALAEVGLAKWTSTLSNSGYEPLECMKLAKRSLDFMGIAGSKWVSEAAVRNEFEAFLSRLGNRGGRVRFLMMDPQSSAFRMLRSMRGGALHAEPFGVWRKLLKKFDHLEVHLYSDLPCFRLAFIDGTEVAVARYKINRDGYFQSKFGWEAPHLVFSAAAKWSFYDPFEAYFRQAWDRSRDLSENIK